MNKRDEAIKRIVSAVYGDDAYEKIASEAQHPCDNEKTDLYQKLSKASEMLKSASAQIHQFQQENDELKEKLAFAQNQLEIIEKHDEAEKLAGIMLRKGMIKKADYDKQIDTIMKFDKQGFEIFKDAIDNVEVDKEASFGATNLDFLYGEEFDDIENEPEKKSMFDVLDKQCSN